MIYLDHPCDLCKHESEELLNGWKAACKAFPEGIPVGFWKINPAKLPECANGYKFEDRDAKDEPAK